MFYGGPGLLVIVNEKKDNESKRTAFKQNLGPIRSFVTGLVSAAVAGVTNPWVNRVVDIVGTAVLNLNEERVLTTVTMLADAEFTADHTVSHSRMIATQTDGKGCITSVHGWT